MCNTLRTRTIFNIIITSSTLLVLSHMPPGQPYQTLKPSYIPSLSRITATCNPSCRPHQQWSKGRPTDST